MTASDDNVKVTTFAVENFKRIRVLEMSPQETGLTVIGGKNKQGKTSALDAIMTALLGRRFLPSNPIHDGNQESSIDIALSNKVTVHVTINSKGVKYKVISKTGVGGVRLLEDFIEPFALNVPSFMRATETERRKMLLGVAGDKLDGLVAQEASLMEKRAVAKKNVASLEAMIGQMPFYEDLPDEPIDETDVLTQINSISEQARQKSLIQGHVASLASEAKNQKAEITRLENEISDLESRLKQARNAREDIIARAEKTEHDLVEAQAKLESFSMADVSVLTEKLDEIRSTNEKIRINKDRERLGAEIESKKNEINALTQAIEDVRRTKQKVAAEVSISLDGIELTPSGFTYKGQAWDCMSHAEQIRVAVAICLAKSPKMGFVLVDKLESLDRDELRDLDQWLRGLGLQAICTRVSTGDECSFILEDGVIAEGNDKGDSA